MSFLPPMANVYVSPLDSPLLGHNGAGLNSPLDAAMSPTIGTSGIRELLDDDSDEEDMMSHGTSGFGAVGTRAHMHQLSQHSAISSSMSASAESSPTSASTNSTRGTTPNTSIMTPGMSLSALSPVIARSASNTPKMTAGDRISDRHHHNSHRQPTGEAISHFLMSSPPKDWSTSNTNSPSSAPVSPVPFYTAMNGSKEVETTTPNSILDDLHLLKYSRADQINKHPERMFSNAFSLSFFFY